jgi:hypothetical protein
MVSGRMNRDATKRPRVITDLDEVEHHHVPYATVTDWKQVAWARMARLALRINIAEKPTTLLG